MEMRGLRRWLLGRVMSAEDRRVVESEISELHARRTVRSGMEAADRRLRRETLWLIWHLTLGRIGRRRRSAEVRGGSGLPGGHRGTDQPKGGSTMTSWLGDLAHALRTLRRQPRLVLMVSITLGLGIGATGAVFGMASEILLRPPPGVNPVRTGLVEFRAPAEASRPRALGSDSRSGADVLAILDEATLLDGFATWDDLRLRISAGDSRPIDVEAQTIHGAYFELLGVGAAAGRLLRSDETGPGSDPMVAVISERVWQELYGGAPDVAGRQLVANGQVLSIVGVAGGGFSGSPLGGKDLWLPRPAFAALGLYPADRLFSAQGTPNQYFMARTHEGVPAEAAEAELSRILEAHSENVEGVETTLHSTLQFPSMRRRALRTLRLLGGAAALLLLITCANVTNLLLVRGARQRGDVAVRRALGASSSRIARHGMLESLLLAAAGTASGLVVAWLIGSLFEGTQLPGARPLEGPVVHAHLLAFAVVATAAATLLSGTLPSLLAGRFAPVGMLRDGSVQTTSRFGLVRGGFSAAQLGLSMTLLVGSVLLLRTVRNVHSVDPGFDIEGLSAVTLDLDRGERDAVARSVLYREVMAAVEAVQTVQSAAIHSWYGPYGGALSARVALQGTDVVDAPNARMHWVTPGWFELFDVEVLKGRALVATDWDGTPPHQVVLTRLLAERLFGEASPLSQTVRVGMRLEHEAVVVGTVGDVRLVNLMDAPDEAIFVSSPTSVALEAPVTLVYRSQGESAAAAEAVRRSLEEVLPAVPIPDPAPLRDRIDLQLREQHLLSRLLGLFSVLAVALSAVGLFAVLGFTVADRKRELGIRIALGADGARIVRLVLASAVGIVLVGTSLGALGAYVMSRTIEGQLFGVEPLDLGSYLGAAVLLAVVSAIACAAPARAALRQEPASVLRQE